MANLPGSNRYVFIIGMAHTGTTLLTYILSKHPNMALLADVGSFELLEFDITGTEEDVAKRIYKFGREHPRRYILLKRPQMEAGPGFFRDYFPDARFYLCRKDHDRVIASWLGPRSCVSNDQKERAEYYYTWLKESADKFQAATGCRHFRIIDYGGLTNDPARIFRQIAADLGITYEFDLSPIGGEDIKSVTQREFMAQGASNA